MINSIHEALAWFLKWLREEGFDPTVLRELGNQKGVYAYVVKATKPDEVRNYVMSFARVWFNSFEKTCRQPPGTGIGITFHKAEVETALSYQGDLALVWKDGKIYGIPALKVVEHCAKYPGAIFSHVGNKQYQKDDLGVAVKMLKRLNAGHDPE